MEGTQPQFGPDDVIVETREVVYQGFFRMEKLTINHKTFAGGWTGPFTRELFERGEAVCVLLYDPNRDELIFTEQFRVGVVGSEQSPWLVELVAGCVEEGESYEDVASRETLEEAGCSFYELIPICRYWVSPGGTSERIQLYCGLIDSTGVGGIHGLAEEHEDIRLCRMDFAQAWEQTGLGRINNAAAIIALQWLKIHRDELRAGVATRISP